MPRLAVDSLWQLASDPQAWIAFLTLTVLEIVLGIDNIVFIAVLTNRLPKDQQPLAYRLGLAGALITRLALLAAISWVTKLTTPLFSIASHQISGRTLILLGGGLFLIGKSVQEIYEKVEGGDEETVAGWSKTMAGVVIQIAILDIIFSLDSVITAVGVATHLEVMMAAIIVAVVVMLIFAKPVGDFVNNRPSMKILALSFLILIGVVLTSEAFGQHIDKRYIYFAMAFAFSIELLNMRMRKRQTKS